MKSSKQSKKVAFWSKVEAAGEGLELSMRCIIGFIFGTLFSMGFYFIGAFIWTSLGILLAIGVFPIGFIVGFFWLEIKFFLRLFSKLFLGFFGD